ncbi:MAG TPA: outer membrane protein transport protein [Vicinamibacteria bacterium]|nr:outer membrane protein transport protein [Vicinamibacteria bacterium]
MALVLLAGARAAWAQAFEGQDRLDTTGRQNLTLGSGARAYGMGGAFLACADDATAASWNPAGLSYLRQPEVSLVGVTNSFSVSRDLDTDTLNGRALDFAAFTSPVGIGEVRGAVQVSYQRAISFDGRREIKEYDTRGLPRRYDEGYSNGGFDLIALGSGLRLTRHLRAGFTVNRWFNGYTQTLHRQVYSVTDPNTGLPGSPPRNPLRYFDLDFRLTGWSSNWGLMWSPLESLNIGAVYKTGFSADVAVEKARADGWGTLGAIKEVTTNADASADVQMTLPRSYGFGASWRPRDTLTLSADFTLTGWSKATILNYFNLSATPESTHGVPAPKPAGQVFGLLQYPTLLPVPTTDDPTDPNRVNGQQDKQEIRVGVEWVLIKGAVKVPLRAGYFSDRQITRDPISGHVPRFNGFTAGIGVGLGPVLLDAAWVYEFGSYYVTPSDTSGGDFDPVTGAPLPSTPLRYALTTNRGFASVIYRFPGRR